MSFVALRNFFQRGSIQKPRSAFKVANSSRRTFNKTPSDNKSKWPSSFKEFVAGEPIITRTLPYFGSCKIDFGTTMMNFGAIVSLTGFACTDVLLLRVFSIVGSVCGIIFH